MFIHLPRCYRPCFKVQPARFPLPPSTNSRTILTNPQAKNVRPIQVINRRPITCPSSATSIDIALRNPTYQWQENVEDLKGYHPGGYHPVHLQDEYSACRYLILHKLGYGTYSTVWLARDQYLNRYVSLKIIVAEASDRSSESKILQHLSKSVSGAGSYNIPFLDAFPIDGPNGRHLCIVSEPAKCSIADSKEASTTWMFSIGISRAIAAQAILGLQDIHSRGVVHGDLHIKNVLLRLPQIDGKIYKTFGEPQTATIKRMDGSPCGPEVPSYSVTPAPLVILSDEVIDPRILICDFGEAWFRDDEIETRKELHLPPEATFAKDLIGAPADIWTLGCTIFEIIGERPLFKGFLPDRDDIIAEMVSCLGMLPQHWWESWQARPEFFLDDGSWNPEMARIHDPKSRPLRQRIQLMGRKNEKAFEADEAVALEKMLRNMLVYNPRERATVSDVLESEWMKGWGFPALEYSTPGARRELLRSHTSSDIN